MALYVKINSATTHLCVRLTHLSVNMLYKEMRMRTKTETILIHDQRGNLTPKLWLKPVLGAGLAALR